MEMCAAPQHPHFALAGQLQLCSPATGAPTLNSPARPGSPLAQVQQALGRQRFTLHEGTPGDNVTVMVITLRKLPDIPRTSASRLNLRSSSTDLLSPTGGGTSLADLARNSISHGSAEFGSRSNGSTSDG